MTKELLQAIESKNIDNVKKLLPTLKEVELNAENENGETLFFTACKTGNLGIVKLMAANKNIDLSRPNKQNETPLFIAAQNDSHHEIMDEIGRNMLRAIPKDNEDAIRKIMHVLCTEETMYIFRPFLQDLQKINLEIYGNIMKDLKSGSVDPASLNNLNNMDSSKNPPPSQQFSI